MITSDKAYKNFETSRGYKENSVLGGIDPYGASKSAAEICIKSYIKSFTNKNKNVLIGIARAGNVIGVVIGQTTDFFQIASKLGPKIKRLPLEILMLYIIKICTRCFKWLSNSSSKTKVNQKLHIKHLILTN